MNRFILTPKNEKYKDDVVVAKVSAKNASSVLRIGVFFDGTGNDHFNPDTVSNIYRLCKMYPITLGESINGETPTCIVYARGVGTSDWAPRKFFETVTGSGGDLRISGAVYCIVEHVKKFVRCYGSPPSKILFDVFGFSRGAATARHFVNIVIQKFFNEGVSEISAVDLEVNFLGLFDTVGSIGIPGNEYNPAYSLNIPLNEINKKTIHLVSEDELRRSFDLISVLDKPQFYIGQDHISSKVEEIICPGVHADIGGGYSNTSEHGLSNNKLEKIYCKLMYEKALECGIPLKLELYPKWMADIFPKNDYNDKEGGPAIQSRHYDALNFILFEYERSISSKFNLRFLCRIYRTVVQTLTLPEKRLERVNASFLNSVRRFSEVIVSTPFPIGNNEGLDKNLKDLGASIFDSGAVQLEETLEKIANFKDEALFQLLDEDAKKIQIHVVDRDVLEDLKVKLKYLIEMLTKSNIPTITNMFSEMISFYENCVHNSLISDSAGALPEYSAVRYRDGEKKRYSQIVRRKVFSNPEHIDLLKIESEFWNNDTARITLPAYDTLYKAYRNDRVSPQHTDTVISEIPKTDTEIKEMNVRKIKASVDTEKLNREGAAIDKVRVKEMNTFKARVIGYEKCATIKIPPPELVDGWWTTDSDGRDPIEKARLGDSVYFHIETKGIALGEVLGAQLYDYDYSLLARDTKNFPNSTVNKIVVVKELDGKNVATIKIELDERWESVIHEDSFIITFDPWIELYWRVKYKDSEKDLPVDKNNCLKVGCPNRTFYFNPSTIQSDYDLPDIRSHDGSDIVFLSGYFKNLAVDRIEKFSENKKKIALAKVKMGSLSGKPNAIISVLGVLKNIGTALDFLSLLRVDPDDKYSSFNIELPDLSCLGPAGAAFSLVTSVARITIQKQIQEWDALDQQLLESDLIKAKSKGFEAVKTLVKESDHLPNKLQLLRYTKGAVTKLLQGDFSTKDEFVLWDADNYDEDNGHAHILFREIQKKYRLIYYIESIFIDEESLYK